MFRKIAIVFPLLFSGFLFPMLQERPAFNEELLNGLKYRNLGPFRAGAWVTDIAVPDVPHLAHMYTFYVGTRNGGVWKTTNNGTTFAPIFDGQDVMSIGALAVSPKDADTVWVGTGDAFFARSPYWGNGVYKTTDGGKSWQNTGLGDTHHIAKIVIDPENPNTVYVSAAGHAYTVNEERGVFKTTDAGKTWTKSLYIDDHTAAIDLVIDPKNPKVLYAATWYRNVRIPGAPATPFVVPGAGAPAPERGGIYKTADAGKTWQKLQGGLPLTRIGRIGLALYVKDPKIVYAIVDNQNRRPLTEAERGRGSSRGGRGGAAAAANDVAIGSEVYRTDDAGRSWRKMNATEEDPGSKAPGTFTIMRVGTENPDHIYSLTSELLSSTDGGRSWRGIRRPESQPVQDNSGQGEGRRGQNASLLIRQFGDFRTLWIDPQNSKRWLIGSDGGVFATYDGGETSEHYNNIPLGEITGLTVDMDNPYHIYVGEQDHEHWKGPVNSWTGGVGYDEWITVGNGDGINQQVDPTDSRWLFTTSENGQHYRVDQSNYTRRSILPRAEPGKPAFRFNWIAPIRLSPHDPAILYTGAQFLLRSMDRGDHWQILSPDLTVDAAAPPQGVEPGVPPARTGGTITTLGESPVTAGVIWVGAQNGRLQVTRNAGGTWTDVTSNVAAAGGPADAYVMRVCPSNFQAGTAYVAKSRYGQDDSRPFLFKTTDFGATWQSISSNLPQRSINVVAEDRVNPRLLFAGTDAGAYATVDGGKHWVSIRCNMPQVSVMDLIVHPRESDLVLGSYGRGAWVMNIAWMRELSDEMLSEDLHFFAVRPDCPRSQRAMGNFRFYGDRNLVTPNEPSGLVFIFYFRNQPEGPVTITVTDAAGKEIRRLTPSARTGLNRILWDMRNSAREQMPAGEYLITLQSGGQKLLQKARILEAAPMVPRLP